MDGSEEWCNAVKTVCAKGNGWTDGECSCVVVKAVKVLGYYKGKSRFDERSVKVCILRTIRYRKGLKCGVVCSAREESVHVSIHWYTSVRLLMKTRV